MNDKTRIIEAIFEDLDATQVRAITRPEPLLRARSLAWIRFARPDIDRQKRFLDDFGIAIAARDAQNLYGCGTGSSPYFYHVEKAGKAAFLGLGFELANEADLAIAARFNGASTIQNVSGPGGGRFVRVTNPDGVQVDFVWGRQRKSIAGELVPAPFTHTRANAPIRPPLEPAKVIKLGHVVLQCTDLDRTMDWWMRHIGIIPSDAQVLADGSVNLAFCRLDLSDEPADHHTLAIAGGIGSLYMHSAYEVADADAIGQGQQVLRIGGWKHGWGIGRHYYGSQIFDYWRDPYGDLVEHYTDGDTYDAAQPTRYSRFTRGSTWMWGQDQPKDFEGVGPAAILLMLKNLIKGEIKWSRIKLVIASLKPPPRPWMK